MIVTYAVVGLVCLAVLGASIAARPTTPHGRQRTEARRRRFVQRHPIHVNLQDIRNTLVREGVSGDQARFITERAVEHDITPFTMWLWLEQFDAESLAIVVAADLSHRDLLAHITEGTVPDLEELKFFAAANGLDIAGPPVRPASRRTMVDSGVTAPERKALPPIHEPGSWPDRPARSPRPGKGGLAA